MRVSSAAGARRGETFPAGDRVALLPRPRHTERSTGGNAAPTCPAARRPPPPSAAACDSAPAPLQIEPRKPPITPLPAASLPSRTASELGGQLARYERRTTDPSPTSQDRRPCQSNEAPLVFDRTRASGETDDNVEEAATQSVFCLARSPCALNPGLHPRPCGRRDRPRLGRRRSTRLCAMHLRPTARRSRERRKEPASWSGGDRRLPDLRRDAGEPRVYDTEYDALAAAAGPGDQHCRDRDGIGALSPRAGILS